MSFLFSSSEPLPSVFFDGYCFAGRDYLFGQRGLEAWLGEGGRTPPFREDGCYALIECRGGEHHVSTDYSGFRKVFYWSSGSRWCISDSLIDLAERLASDGERLSLDFSQLAGYTVKSTMAMQLSSFRTPFVEIKLLPTFASLVIGGTGLRVRFHEVEECADYRTGLTGFIETWLQRFETLLCTDSLDVSIDLTGGADSRAVFALLLAAGRRVGADLGKVAVRSNRGSLWSTDLSIASRIVGDYGLALDGRGVGGIGVYRSEDESYRAWREACLGVYLPIYFPATVSGSEHVHFHGGGGENHRPFYPTSDPNELLGPMKGSGPPSYLIDQWKLDVVETVRELRERQPAMDGLLLHYREFRNRIHTGRAPLYATTMTPLSSRLLEGASNSGVRLPAGQVNFDIMESLVPGLIGYEYDDPGKHPSGANLCSLADVNVSRTPAPGAVYGVCSGEATGTAAREQPDRRFELLKREFDASRSRFAQKFLGRRSIDVASVTLEEAVRAGGFSHASSARVVSRAILCGRAGQLAGLD